MKTPTQDELKKTLKSSNRVFVFSGAGASKESGLPTFRETDGEWKKYDPMTFATMEGFNSDPVLVWTLYKQRLTQIAEAKPNKGHIALGDMEKYFEFFRIVTQNVDNLHERGGSSDVVHIHGNAQSMRCTKCENIVSVDDFLFPKELNFDNLPRCQKCKSLYRPNIVWFGEYLPQAAMEKATFAAATCDLMLIVGTSGEVSGGYGFIDYALANRATVIDINPNTSNLTQKSTYHIAEPSGSALPKILSLLKNQA